MSISRRELIKSVTLTTLGLAVGGSKAKEPSPTYEPFAFTSIGPGPEVKLPIASNVTILNETAYALAIQEEALQRVVAGLGIEDIPIRMSFLNRPLFVFHNPQTGLTEQIDDPNLYPKEATEEVVALSNPFRGGGAAELDLTKPVLSAAIQISLPSIENKIPKSRQVDSVWGVVVHELYHVSRHSKGDPYYGGLNTEAYAEGYGHAAIFKAEGLGFNQYLDYTRLDPQKINPIDRRTFDRLPFIGNHQVGIYFLNWNK